MLKLLKIKTKTSKKSTKDQDKKVLTSDDKKDSFAVKYNNNTRYNNSFPLMSPSQKIEAINLVLPLQSPLNLSLNDNEIEFNDKFIKKDNSEFPKCYGVLDAPVIDLSDEETKKSISKNANKKSNSSKFFCSTFNNHDIIQKPYFFSGSTQTLSSITSVPSEKASAKFSSSSSLSSTSSSSSSTLSVRERKIATEKRHEHQKRYSKLLSSTLKSKISVSSTTHELSLSSISTISVENIYSKSWEKSANLHKYDRSMSTSDLTKLDSDFSSKCRTVMDNDCSESRMQKISAKQFLEYGDKYDMSNTNNDNTLICN